MAVDKSRLAPTGTTVAGSAPWLRRAIVIFEDRADLLWLLPLRKGFRHCFCAVGNGADWIILDPLKGSIETFPIFDVRQSDLAAQFCRAGRTVLSGGLSGRPSIKPTFLRPLTCVEIVKRMLRFDAPDVFTPAQLHGALISRCNFEAVDAPLETQA